MPATVVKRGDKYRVVRSEDMKLIRRPNGKPVDGGGHDDKKIAVSQACKINISLQERDVLTGRKPIDLALEANTRRNLPDRSFALIESGGEIDSSGRTTPRSLRKLPYLTRSGLLMRDQAEAALAALNGARGEVSATKEQKDRAWGKIVSAIRAETVGYDPPEKLF